MRRSFDSYIIIDWSAASKPTTGENSIWIGLLMPDARFKLGFSAQNPPTRAEAESIVFDAVDRLRHRGDRILIGVDFSLGFPHGFTGALSLPEEGPPWERVFRFLQREMKDKPTNANNRYPLASMVNRRISNEAFPFWGCAKRDETTTLSSKKTREHQPGDLPEYRVTERAAQNTMNLKPQPIWKLAYQGAVGSQSLTGIPFVARLRARFDEARLWPFETGFDADTVADADIVICEVYPSLVAIKQEPNEPKDRAQVRALAQHLAAQDEKDNLKAYFSPPGDLSDEDVAIAQLEEGWILGI